MIAGSSGSHPSQVPTGPGWSGALKRSAVGHRRADMVGAEEVFFGLKTYQKCGQSTSCRLLMINILINQYFIDDLPRVPSCLPIINGTYPSPMTKISCCYPHDLGNL